MRIRMVEYGVVALAIALAGCGGGGSSLPTDPNNNGKSTLAVGMPSKTPDGFPTPTIKVGELQEIGWSGLGLKPETVAIDVVDVKGKTIEAVDLTQVTVRVNNAAQGKVWYTIPKSLAGWLIGFRVTEATTDLRTLDDLSPGVVQVEATVVAPVPAR